MEIIKSIREFFWPLLDDPKSKNKSEEFNKDNIQVNSEYLETLLEQAVRDYESEEERRKSIESKSSLFIGTVSVITSIIIGVTSFLIDANNFNPVTFILILLLVILCIYMIRTVWFAIKALERKGYHAISIKDFLNSDQGDEYYKKIIVNIVRKIHRNYSAINSKVDSMVMAQEYFKRAISTIALYAFLILILYSSKFSESKNDFFQSVINVLQSTDSAMLIMAGPYFISCIAIGISIYVYSQSKKV